MTKKNKKGNNDFVEYNDGRLSADRKWVEAIDARIEELEIQVGIPELRRLKEKTKYRWKDLNE